MTINNQYIHTPFQWQLYCNLKSDVNEWFIYNNHHYFNILYKERINNIMKNKYSSIEQ